MSYKKQTLTRMCGKAQPDGRHP